MWTFLSINIDSKILSKANLTMPGIELDITYIWMNLGINEGDLFGNIIIFGNKDRINIQVKVWRTYMWYFHYKIMDKGILLL